MTIGSTSKGQLESRGLPSSASYFQSPVGRNTRSSPPAIFFALEQLLQGNPPVRELVQKLEKTSRTANHLTVQDPNSADALTRAAEELISVAPSTALTVQANVSLGKTIGHG